MDHNENNQEGVQQEFIETASPTTKASLQCNLGSFRMATLKRSKARQRLYSHRYSHILNIDQFQYSVEESDDMNEEDHYDLEVEQEAAETGASARGIGIDMPNEEKQPGLTRSNRESITVNNEYIPSWVASTAKMMGGRIYRGCWRRDYRPTWSHVSPAP